MSNNNKKKMTYFILVPFIEYHIAGFVCTAANHFFANPYITHLFLGIAFIPVVISTWFKIHQFFQWKKQFNIFINIVISLFTYIFLLKFHFSLHNSISLTILIIALLFVSRIKIEESKKKIVDGYFEALLYAYIFGFPALIAVYGIVLVVNAFVKIL